MQIARSHTIHAVQRAVARAVLSRTNGHDFTAAATRNAAGRRGVCPAARRDGADPPRARASLP